MSDVSIRLSGVSKRYRLGATADPTLRESLQGAAARLLGRDGTPGQDARTLWALRDVSAEIRRGEIFGIIGRNGAGKSTLLKLIARITHPTEGRIEVDGRVGSLLEVGTGFHPDLTGEENVYLNGSLLGMRRAEIRAKFDEIVAFSGVERFLDTPVKHYSSGMYVRLAFAVAAHLETDILLVDEVLAVGDLRFQRKCLGKVRELTSGGRTVLLVSHSTTAIASHCTRAILLAHGRIAEQGPARDIIQSYIARETERQGTPVGERSERGGSGEARILALSLSNGRGSGLRQVLIAEPFRADIEVEFAGHLVGRNVRVGLQLRDRSDARVVSLYTDVVSPSPIRIEAPRMRFTCDVREGLPLLPGSYGIDVGVFVDGACVDGVEYADSIEVLSADFYGTGHMPPPVAGPVLLRYRWDACPEDAPPA